MGLAWTLLIFHVLFASSLANVQDYSGSQVLKVLNDNHGLIKNLIKQENLDVWHSNGTHTDVLVPSTILESFKNVLRHQKVPYKTIINDVKEAIEKQNPSPSKRIGNEMNWNQYQRLGVIHQYLDTLAKRYPNFVSVGIMGKSLYNQPLKYIKISSGKPNAKTVFIDGGIHAREWISVATVTYIIRELVENRNNLPKELLDLDYYILPVLNPDGYEYTFTGSRMWRKNRSKESRCGGTDLNRNFDFMFGGEGTSGDPCEEIYRGKSAASEPETKAVQKFLTSIRKNLKAYITFHSYGQYILIPYGYQENKLAPGYKEMKRVGDAAADAIRRVSGTAYEVGNTANLLYSAAGGSDDWAKAKLGVPYVYTLELRDAGRYGFLLPARFILPTAKETFEGVKVIAAAAAKA